MRDYLRRTLSGQLPLFSLSSDNAVVQLLGKGGPRIAESQVDSKKVGGVRGGVGGRDGVSGTVGPRVSESQVDSQNLGGWVGGGARGCWVGGREMWGSMGDEAVEHLCATHASTL